MAIPLQPSDDDRAFVLPGLRSDLRLARGAPDTDGTPMWTLFDPLRNQYFHLHLQGLRLIRQWHGGDTAGELADAVRERGVAVSAEEVVGMARFMTANNLIAARGAADTQRLAQQHARSQTRWHQWLLHRYLFFRIPLLRPDAALSRWLPWARRLVSRPARYLFVLVGLIALALVIRQWEQLAGTFMRFLSWEGLAWYGVALISVKSAHELGHAFVAKHYGCRVPTIGIAFLVLVPMLYTDATDTWRLTRDAERLRVSLAGVATEMAIAVLATFAWGVLPDGGLRQAAFFLATTSWVATLLINLSPFMRFDGYHVLSDVWGIRNLQPRAFALTRWRMREALFGFGEAPPEAFAPGRRRLMIAYAVATWIYRFFLFLGIALLVYHFAFKALGIFLFCVEIGYFILRPVLNEIGEVSQRRLRWNRALLRTLLFGAGLVALLFVPWRGTLGLPAVLEAAEHAAIHAPEAARIKRVAVESGAQVSAGQTLFVLDKPELALGTEQARRKIDVIQTRLARRAGSQRDLDAEGVLRTQLAELRAELAGLAARERALVLESPFDARVVDRADLRAGQYVSAREELADLVAPGAGRVYAYVGEQDVARIELGAKARFIPDDGDHGARDLEVVRVEDVGTERLPYPVLASTYGGPLAVSPERTEGDRALRLEDGVYRVVLRPVGEGDVPRWRLAGTAVVDGPPESIAGRLFRHAASVFIRESGF
ncbi:HlyD family efflux transporter periplasmic adaptor subunit [Salinisphaera sp. T31B1]|uniref:HlyD family efflux transporter periplasmic adaptor subunit n=1 Tax=Salinisphaera sp. T31B1 TaxID=727963 RepID=UPI00333E9FD9